MPRAPLLQFMLFMPLLVTLVQLVLHAFLPTSRSNEYISATVRPETSEKHPAEVEMAVAPQAAGTAPKRPITGIEFEGNPALSKT
jgi:hypothetical protein